MNVSNRLAAGQEITAALTATAGARYPRSIMRIARFVSDDGQVQVGELLNDSDTARVVKGDFERGFEPTRFTAKVKKLLAPLVPTDILCIGINYREHAAESNAAIPQNP